MDRKEFVSLLIQKEISPEMISFDNCIDEGYCVRKKGYYWVVSIWERGTEYNLHAFDSESEALQYLYKKLEYSLLIAQSGDKRTQGMSTGDGCAPVQRLKYSGENHPNR